MFGFQEEISPTVLVSPGCPSEPSPVAATIIGAPGAGVVPEVGWNVFPLGGGLLNPFEKVTVTEAAVVMKASRIVAVAEITCVPSPQRLESSVNV